LTGGITSKASTATATATGAFKSGSSTGAPNSTGSSAALPTAPLAGSQRLAIIASAIVIGFSMGVIVTF